MSQAQTLTPVIRFGAMNLPFPDPSMSPDEARRLHAANWPALEQATLAEPTAEPDTGYLVYEAHRPQAARKGRA